MEHDGKKIAILGTATTTLECAPVNDPSWEIWACSPWMQGKLHPRSETTGGFDRFFEVHPLSQFAPCEVTDFIPWMAKCGKPVHVFHDLGLPNQVFCEKEKIEAQHGSAFLTSTIAWMLAIAIEERPAQIGIWGVDMADGTEYAYQKQGCLHFIALARLLGIDIVLPSESELRHVPAAYPDRYATDIAIRLTKKIEKTRAELAEIERNLKVFEEARNMKRGELDAFKSMYRTMV